MNQIDSVDGSRSGRLSKLSRSVAGRCAIVTGAASGMGRAIAHLLADEGASVVVADLGTERVAKVVNEIAEVYGPSVVLGLASDVSDPVQLAELVEATIRWSGRLDIVVNNAGRAAQNSPFQDADEFEETWASTLEVNLTAHARLVRYALPHLLESDCARIVNIASTEAIVASPRAASYAASKAGVTGLTRSLAVELGPHGITVNCICPGPVDTAMTAYIPADVRERYSRRRVPLRRYGDPEEIAHMVLNLVQPSSSFVTGVVVPVDGGMTVRHI